MVPTRQASTCTCLPPSGSETGTMDGLGTQDGGPPGFKAWEVSVAKSIS